MFGRTKEIKAFLCPTVPCGTVTWCWGDLSIGVSDRDSVFHPSYHAGWNFFKGSRGVVNVLGFVFDTFVGNGFSKEYKTKELSRHVFLRILVGNLSKTVNCKSSLEQVSCYASVLLCAGSECKRFCGNLEPTKKSRPYNHLTYDVGKCVQNNRTFSTFPSYNVAKTTWTTVGQHLLLRRLQMIQANDTKGCHFHDTWARHGNIYTRKPRCTQHPSYTARLDAASCS